MIRLTLALSLGILTACAPLQRRAETLARQATARAAQPVLEKILFAEVPLLPSSRSVFPTVDKLPGQEFDPLKDTGKKWGALPDGRWSLRPGDYVIPVMTYCLKAAGGSPAAHRYLLSEMRGKNADILRELHRRALRTFPPKEVQVLSWAIQNGLPYEKMSVKSKAIVDKHLPEYRKRLQTSFFDVVTQKWNTTLTKIPGIPRFESLTDDFLETLGEFGDLVRTLRRYRSTVQSRGHDYDSLSRLISPLGVSKTPGTSATTPWSRVSDRVYARFLTKLRYQQPGYLEIRVLPPRASGSSPVSGEGLLAHFFAKDALAADADAVPTDVSAWAGDPGQGGIQPLGFSPLLGAGTFPLLSPAAFATLMAALIAANLVDWAAVYDALEQGSREALEAARSAVDRARQMAREEHNKLEKPARDAGILEGAEDTTSNSNNPTRQYDKTGGRDQLKADFDSLPYPEGRTGEGQRTKTAPDGTKYIERSEGTGTTPPTLEIQPADAGRGGGNPIRVKVRYP